MELVPKEELETSTEGNSLADKRARKVSILASMNEIDLQI